MNNLHESKPIIYTAQSKYLFFAKDMIAQFVIDQDAIPLNPFNNWHYFLNDTVARDLVVRANNNLVRISDEIWQFGPIADGCLHELHLALANDKNIRFFSAGKRYSDIKDLPPEDLQFEDEVTVTERKKFLSDLSQHQTKKLLPPHRIGVGCGIIVIKDDQVLLGKRAADTDLIDTSLHGGNTWALPGGKLHHGETFEAAAQRKLIEETSITAKTFKTISLQSDINNHAHFITVGVLAENPHGEPQLLEPAEITEWRWFPLGNLPKNLYPPTQKILAKYQSSKFYDEKESANV